MNYLYNNKDFSLLSKYGFEYSEMNGGWISSNKVTIVIDKRGDYIKGQVLSFSAPSYEQHDQLIEILFNANLLLKIEADFHTKEAEKIIRLANGYCTNDNTKIYDYSEIEFAVNKMKQHSEEPIICSKGKVFLNPLGGRKFFGFNITTLPEEPNTLVRRQLDVSAFGEVILPNGSLNPDSFLQIHVFENRQYEGHWGCYDNYELQYAYGRFKIESPIRGICLMDIKHNSSDLQEIQKSSHAVMSLRVLENIMRDVGDKVLGNAAKQ